MPRSEAIGSWEIQLRLPAKDLGDEDKAPATAVCPPQVDIGHLGCAYYSNTACQVLRDFPDSSPNRTDASHAAAIITNRSGLVLDYDYRGDSLLKAGNVLRLVAGELRCADEVFQERFQAAFQTTVQRGRTTNILLFAANQSNRRFSLSLIRMLRHRTKSRETGSDADADILCLVAPLDHRRVATARQLMDLFGLSAAEARLARAIGNGRSAEEYAEDQALRLPTVRSQLRSIFHKTGTGRQADLVRVIAGIPVVRDCI